LNSPELEKNNNANVGQLYIVATPIGNLDDFSARGQHVLSSVAVILAEDTRHSKRLTSHFGINTRLKSCHEHNESEQVEWLVSQLERGDDIALISDAGTPLISDPGFILVRALRQRGFSICAIPGPSSIIAALSIAGLPTDRFIYDGFLPSKSVARCKQLAEYLTESRTIVLLESSHRIKSCLQDCVSVFGAERRIVIARELTKKFETVLSGTVEQILQQLEGDSDQTRGEFVLMLEGAILVKKNDMEVLQLLSVLEQELPLKKAAGIAAQITGRRKNEIYELAISNKVIGK